MVSKTKLLKSNEYHTGPGYNSKNQKMIAEDISFQEGITKTTIPLKTYQYALKGQKTQLILELPKSIAAENCIQASSTISLFFSHIIIANPKE